MVSLPLASADGYKNQRGKALAETLRLFWLKPDVITP